MMTLQILYGLLQILQVQLTYHAEAISGFAMWAETHLRQVVTSEYLDGAATSIASGIQQEDICKLSFANASFDLAICNELFKHVRDLNTALKELRRILRPGARLLVIFPIAFGQQESITKATLDNTLELTKYLETPDYHGDPIRSDPNPAHLFTEFLVGKCWKKQNQLASLKPVYIPFALGSMEYWESTLLTYS